MNHPSPNPAQPRARHLSVLLLVLLLLATATRAQAPPVHPTPQGLPDAPQPVDPQTPLPPNETEAERKARLHREGDREVKVEEKQRIAVVVPNFTTVMGGHTVPLSPGQKTNLALHSTFDPFNFVGAVFNAGVAEINGTHRGFGWGPQGYAKHVGANLADVFDSSMLAGAVYPILLHQDPRFYRQGTGSIRSRVRHALLRAVVCRGDNGRPQPNYSNILGNFTAGLISNAYYPASDTGIGLSIVNSTIQTAEGAAGNIALEFSPDVDAYLQRRRERKALARQSIPAAPSPPTPGPATPSPATPSPASSPNPAPKPIDPPIQQPPPSL